MIPTNDGVYVDACDPLYATLATFASWEAVKRRVGANLTRLLAGDYLLISSAEDDPDYASIRGEIHNACRSLNAKD